MNQNKNIVGKWIKIKLSSCSEKYPDELEFLENGIYSGSKGDNKNEYTVWNSGTYEIISDDRIKISIANDEIIVYNFSTHDNKLYFVDEENCQIQYKDVISHISEIPRPQSFRRGLVFGVGFSLFLVSIITAKNMWEYFINKSININEISLLIFSAWGISYVAFLWISFLLVVIKRLPGCVWTAINQASDLYKNGSLKSKIHICEDSVYNARLDKMQEKNGISTNLLRTESARSWIIGLLLLLVLVYFLVIDLFSLFLELILIGLFSSIYFLYDITIHRFSIDKTYLTGEGDYPRLISEFLRALVKGSYFKKSS